MFYPIPSLPSTYKIYALPVKKPIEKSTLQLALLIFLHRKIRRFKLSWQEWKKLLEMLLGCVSQTGNATSKGSHILLVIKVTPPTPLWKVRWLETVFSQLTLSSKANALIGKTAANADFCSVCSTKNNVSQEWKDYLRSKMIHLFIFLSCFPCKCDESQETDTAVAITLQRPIPGIVPERRTAAVTWGMVSCGKSLLFSSREGKWSWHCLARAQTPCLTAT